MRLDLPLADLLTALIAGGAVLLGLAVGIGLMRRRGAHRRANVFLGLFLFAGALTLLNEVVIALELYRLSAHFYITPLLYTFSLGPLIAGFVRARVQPDWRLGWRDAPHAILPAWQIVHEVITGFAPLSFKATFWQTPYAQVYGRIDIVLFVVGFGAYLVAAAHIARAATETGPWLARLVRGCAVILGVAVVAEGLSRMGGQFGLPFDWLDLGSTAAYAALMYWTSLTGWVHTLALPVVPAAPAAPRQETYGIDAEALATHVEALRRLVEADAPHLDSGLTLGALSDRLRLTDKELSYVLNEGLRVGYNDYVNRLRVAEAQRRLADLTHDGASILEIAMASGFASKATFNRAFKRETGQTPTVFRAEAPRLTTS